LMNRLEAKIMKMINLSILKTKERKRNRNLSYQWKNLRYLSNKFQVN